jgi:hypothetical protein
VLGLRPRRAAIAVIAAAIAAPPPSPPPSPRRHRHATAIATMRKALPHSLLKYYSNVEYTQHRPHEKIDFFVRLVLFFLTAHIFFATARKN